MSAGAIGGTTLGSANAQLDTNRFADLSSTEFINILVTELTQQDPFEPNDSAQILEQLSSLRSIESQNALQEQLEKLVTDQSIASSSQMIGKYIKGLDANNNAVEGLVASLKVEDGAPILKLADGLTIPADRITEVQDLGDLDTQIVQQLLSNLLVLNSSALVGKQVVGKDINDATRSGLVTSVQPDDNEVYLELDTGDRVRASTVTRMSEPD